MYRVIYSKKYRGARYRIRTYSATKGHWFTASLSLQGQIVHIGGDGRNRTYSPEGTDLQSAATLLLSRISIVTGISYGSRTHLYKVKACCPNR